ncbi:YceI family protein [Streptosporangium roseum]|uniref:YceI-like family protein n=1 Tax=Streptosporangium roseum (strain ATCC 12428 / DSM 43021 / JCM 3005 / KCTC 9067 / NCIMB 10171 / NRRL 2505 / NI 9100) TaxID=479432 RepID=D2BFU6_STRRD|nr:YceI family protein [Streptosporangium roseum]ACZ90257.1 YceI-like family protein [Streptosporangium roseum DSM 43021]
MTATSGSTGSAVTSETTPAGWPAAGVWEIDPRHTSVQFTIQHLVVARVRGRFDTVTGSFEVTDPAEGSRLSVGIEAAGVSSGVARRDDHLRSPDFLHAEAFPAITYVSTAVRPGEGSAFTIEGELTLRGVTRPVELAARYLGAHSDGGVPLLAFSATGSVVREDFGVTFNRALEAGGLAIGSRVDIEILLEALPEGTPRHVL